MESRAVVFEDIHSVAARLAAGRLGRAQKRAANREARRLSETIGARQAEVKAQIRRIGFINEAAKLIGDDRLGFHLAMETDTRELGIIHYILSASNSALDAAKNLSRYHHLVNTTTSLVLEDGDRHVTIDTTFRPGLEGFEKQIAEWGTTAFLAELRRLTNSNMVPQRLTFVHRRGSEVREFEDFFGCQIRFGANRQSIVFAKKDLVLPIHSADPHLLNILKAFCEDALSRRTMPLTPVRSRVERTLLEVMPKGEATVPNVAKVLAMSPRSLERRLNEEGTSYTAVLSELRRELALQYLGDKTLGIGQIAWLLGYSEVTSFNHAFRRWTSRSPKNVRAGLKKSGGR
jgi:AraC-like DNA-binding protein